MLLKLIYNRLYAILQKKIAQEEAVFTKNRETREEILNPKQLIEKTREYGKQMVLYFADVKKHSTVYNWALQSSLCG